MTLEMKTNLYPYQQEAVNKLLPLSIGALYMEMGTGKTRTALEIISTRLLKRKIKKVLWLCPCSVKQNLKDDLSKHSDGWETIIDIEGIESLSSSDRLYLKLLKYVDASTMIIVDESNLIKNFFAKRSKRIIELGKVVRYKMILNGTPVARSEADLYAQWYFLDQRIFGYRTFWSFAANHLERDEYGRVVRVLNVDYLARKMQPYSVVVKKDDVLDLPSKKVTRDYFWLTPNQAAHYNRIADRMLAEVDEFDETTIYRTFTALQLITSGRYITSTEKPLQSEPFFSDPLDNPRITALLSNLRKEKTIIWIKFRHESDEISSVLPEGSWALFTGELPLKKRFESLERFKTDPNFLYLIANKNCGGYGLNLQFCHHAIYYSNDFNFGTRSQSEDRIHRLGQNEEVDLIDLVSDQKIDHRIIWCLDHKKSLSAAFKEALKKGKEVDFLK